MKNIILIHNKLYQLYLIISTNTLEYIRVHREDRGEKVHPLIIMLNFDPFRLISELSVLCCFVLC